MLRSLYAIIAAPVFAQDLQQFNIGVMGGENAQDRMTSNECLRKHAEETLGVPVKLFTPADYDGVIQGLLGGTLDMALLGASGYAKIYLTDPEAVEPVLVKTNLDGGFTYFSIGIARKDSGVRTVKQLAGKKVAVPTRGSTQDISLRHLLHENGLKASDEGGNVTIVPIDPANMPAAFAAVTPLTLSSMTSAWCGSAPIAAAACRNKSGAGLPCLTICEV